jgi:hypothetical protein
MTLTPRVAPVVAGTDAASGAVLVRVVAAVAAVPCNIGARRPERLAAVR